MPDVKFCRLCGAGLVLKKINGKEYMACPSEQCADVFWDNPLPVVAALIEHEGKVILARNKAWPEKVFGLITGFLEKNETPENAVLREVKEELGLDAKIISMIGLYSFFEKNQLIMAYHLKAGGEIMLGDELAEVKSVPPDKVRPWPFGTGLAVRDWLDARGKKSEGTGEERLGKDERIKVKINVTE